ncbi:MAG: carbamoyl-phosphate synthase large subunit [Betaproteobacteria bacterium]|nr:carbamoyl-phosphate synthase large subunit [Betaproteobacteria bacterium]
MTLKRLLIANRGEIAVRIARSAHDLGIRTVAVHSEDDRTADHVFAADEVRPLALSGPAAYLDADRIVEAALAAHCDAIHPGYGFLSEDSAFATRCADAGVRFVGPAPEVLALFGDKARARALARQCGVPVLAGLDHAVSLDEARDFLHGLGPNGAVMIKAVAGGGGRGMRPVHTADELEHAFERCRSEARTAFGRADVYVERFLPRARHVEVQVIGDGTGRLIHLGERECSIQRNHQKLVEIAPAPGLAEYLRRRLLDAALAMARSAGATSLITFEFLVATDNHDGRTPEFAFIEANPRLQVEHTVTEATTGLDLVALQLSISGGRTLASMGLSETSQAGPRGMAMELRVNAETVLPDGTLRPASGTLDAFDPPSGPGVRVDTAMHAGSRVSPRFDSLLAKVIVQVVPGNVATLAVKARRALSEFRIAGIDSNRDFLLNLVSLPAFVAEPWHTEFVTEHLAPLTAATAHPRLFPERRDRAREDADAPDGGPPAPDEAAVPEGMQAIAAPVPGTLVSVAVAPGDTMTAGQPLAIVEAMKMEHVVTAPFTGTVHSVGARPGDTLGEGTRLIVAVRTADAIEDVSVDETVDPDTIREDLAVVLERRGLTLDEARPDAVARRHEGGRRTARENIADLCDADSFQEYGAFVVAAQRSRRTFDDLARRTPADGLVAGIGRVNGELFPDRDARAVVLAYDYTVLAGTQGSKNHEKKDRMFELAARWRLPVVVFAEGGGGRPGDTDTITAGSLHIRAFTLLAQLSGLVTLVGIVSGRCFAGNAVVAGCCDVIIATERSALGMGGPAMIEGGGLGSYQPDEIGPTDVQRANGVVDIVARDEADATRLAKKYLSYFQGPVTSWTCPDQRPLRQVVPENRVRVYDVRRVLDILADDDSVLELRRDFARNMITAFIRIEGRPLGVIANNPMVLGGAIDAPAADKAARFLQLCDGFDIPVLSLCDTPGNMVGPDAERTALVRHCCRLYVVGANLTVPIFSVVLRKAYGLGAQGMVGGSFHVPLFSVAWPTGEFGPMNLEGAVRLGFRKELESIADPDERRKKFEELVAGAYDRGTALSTATLFEIDDVIDPADTRARIAAGLRALPPCAPRAGKKRGWIDTW